MAEIVTLPGLKPRFVAGLYWRHEDRRPKAGVLIKSSREYGRWGLGRKTSLGSFQSGYLDPIPGLNRPSGLLSLAAVVADVRQEPWQGVYELGDGRYWLIAVRDNQGILPRGDVIADFDTIDRLQAELASVGDWDRVKGTAADLADLIGKEGVKRQRAARIRDLQHKTWVAPLVTVAAVGVAGAVGMHLWRTHQRELAIERAAALARQQAIERAMAEKAAAARKPVVPWQQMPTNAALLDACGASWSVQKLDTGGWDLQGWKCSADRARVTIETQWESAGGSPLDAPGTMSLDARSSRDSAAGPQLVPQSASNVVAKQLAVRAIMALHVTYGLDVSLQAVPPGPPAQPGRPAAAPVPWEVLQVQIKSPAPLWALGLAPALNDIPGLRLSHVFWSSTGWVANGHLYTR